MEEHHSRVDGGLGSQSAGWRARRGRWRAPGAVLAAALALLVLVPGVSALMAGEGLMWTVWSSAPVELVVCWENPADADPLVGESDQTPGWQRREWVRLALKNTWEREARIIFVGWEECDTFDVAPPLTLGPRRPGTADENLKILITSSGGGQNPGHGSWGDYMESGVRLNLHNANQAWYEYLAIHEFGHALGLYHGEERSDWPTDIPGCPPQDWGDEPIWPWWPIPTELQWGAPDRDSVMAYCSNGPNFLSPKDIAGIQRAYERHLPGTLLSLPASLCLSSHASGPNGEAAFGWECDEAYDDQEWHYDVAERALYITSPSDPVPTRRCLDVDSTNWTDVQIWDCLGGTNQQWQFRRVMVRGYGGLCLTRPPAGAGALTMESCTGDAAQLWRVEQGEIPGFVRLVSDTGNLCLTLDGGSGSDALAAPCSLYRIYLPLVAGWTGRGAPMIATEGGPGADSIAAPEAVRDFYLGEGGKIVKVNLFSDNLCLDVQDVWDSQFTSGLGGPAAGQRVQFFTCYAAQLNQKWGFSGNLISGYKCLALAGSATTNGAAAVMERCSSEVEQKWDYHW